LLVGTVSRAALRTFGNLPRTVGAKRVRLTMHGQLPPVGRHHASRSPLAELDPAAGQQRRG
jgi:hypothetical protein